MTFFFGYGNYSPVPLVYSVEIQSGGLYR